MPRLVPVLFLLLALLLVAPPTAAQTSDVDYRRPVPGRVLRRFDGGTGPYSAGHRGVDLAVRSGEVVGSAGRGRVSFSGVVVGVRWVSVVHPDGVRTSYGPLARAQVGRGEAVRAGQPVGIASGAHDGTRSLHWSARRGSRYVDPLSLLRPEPWQPTLIGAGGWHLADLPDVPHYGPWNGEHRWGFVPGSPDADGPGWLLPPNPNHVVVVGGFGSHSGSFRLDPTDLGYAPSQVTELSHAGRDPSVRGSADDPRRDQRPYRGAHTLVGIETLARQLRDQLRAHHAAHPGQAVDLIGHSMGGVVVLHYLLTMHDPTDPSLPPLDHVVTLASPLQGADLANLADGLDDGLVLGALLALTGKDEVTGASTTRDLEVGSQLLRDLADAWADANADVFSGPLAVGTEVLTVGASRDLVVPEHRTDLPGAQHVVVPGSHSGALETEAVRIVVRDFLAGEVPPGEAGGIGHLLSYPMGVLERGAGALAPRLDQVLPLGPVRHLIRVLR